MKIFLRVVVFFALIVVIFLNFYNPIDETDLHDFESVKEVSNSSFSGESKKFEGPNVNSIAPASSVDVSKEVGVSDVHKAWATEKLNAEKELSIRNKFNIESGVLEGLNIRPGFIDGLSQEDIIYLPIPNGYPDVKVRVTRVVVENNIKTVVGVIDGLGVGYGVTFSYGDNILVGNIISETGSWSIDTLLNTVFITNGLKSEGYIPNDTL